MAVPTNITSTLLASAQCSNGAGQVQWWQYELDLADGATTLEVAALRAAGPVTGAMLGAYDNGGAGLSLDGGPTTGCNIQITSPTVIGFVSQTNGAQGVAIEALTDFAVTIVWAV